MSHASDREYAFYLQELDTDPDFRALFIALAQDLKSDKYKKQVFLEDLPTEIFPNVTQYLSTNEKGRLGKSSRRLNEITSDDPDVRVKKIRSLLRFPLDEQNKRKINSLADSPRVNMSQILKDLVQTFNTHIRESNDEDLESMRILRHLLSTYETNPILRRTFEKLNKALPDTLEGNRRFLKWIRTYYFPNMITTWYAKAFPN